MARTALVSITLRNIWLRAFGTAIVIISAACAVARAEPVDDVIEALKIRDYLHASEDECRAAAREQADRQISAFVQTRLAAHDLDGSARARLEDISRTYAREACNFGVEDGLIQRYRATYAASLSEADLAAASRFLATPEGKNFVAAGLAANRDILPVMRRRQESQAARAAALLRTRLSSFLAEFIGGGASGSDGKADAQ